MALARPTRVLTLTLLLGACGPGKSVDDGDTASSDSTSSDPGDGSIGGTATGDTPTSTAPDDGTGTGTGTSGPGTTRGPGSTDDATATGDSTTGGAATGRLVGLGFVRSDQVWHTVELDRFTGELTVLAALPASIHSVSQGDGAFDPATRRVFHPTGDGRLLTFDADSGEFLAAPTLVPDALASVMNLEINNAGALVGLAPALHTQIVTIDPDTGVVTPLAELPPELSQIAEGIGAFDPATDRMFQITGDHRLLVFDAGTGALLGNVALVGADSSDVYDLAVDNAGQLVGIGNRAFPDPWVVVRVDPLTGVVTTLSELPAGLSFVQGQNIHDAALDQMFLQTSDPKLLVLDAGTGQLLTTTPIMPGIDFLNPVLVP